MICPECRSEYREGFTRCSDCDVDLVESVPVDHDVTIARVYASTDASAIALYESLLRDASIEFTTANEPLRSLFVLPGSSLAEVQFFVREEDAEEARAIGELLDMPVEPATETETAESEPEDV